MRRIVSGDKQLAAAFPGRQHSEPWSPSPGVLITSDGLGACFVECGAAGGRRCASRDAFKGGGMRHGVVEATHQSVQV